MTFMAWKPEYSVGVDLFDSQHKHLIDLLNRLYDAMMEGYGQDVLGSTLSELIQYTRTHFVDEEKAFEATGYPESYEHQMEHIALRTRVEDFQARFEAGEVALSMETTAFLQGWLEDHILGSDRKYGPHLNQHDVR